MPAPSCSGDATIAPRGAPTVEVVATAKKALKAGETIDDIGYYMTYGQCENADVVFRDRLLPMGLAAGCRLRRDLAQDAVLTYDDVELPSDRLVDIYRAEQDALYASAYEPDGGRPTRRRACPNARPTSERRALGALRLDVIREPHASATIVSVGLA